MLKLLVLTLALTACSQPSKAHDAFISQQNLRNAAGEWCCSEVDCKELNYTPKPVEGGVELREGNEFIPMKEIMPLSPSAWWICRRPDGTRRCVFSPPNSY